MSFNFDLDLDLDLANLLSVLTERERSAINELVRFHFFASRGTPEDRCVAAHVAESLIAFNRVCLQYAVRPVPQHNEHLK